MARTRFTNPQPVVELQYQPYQWAFLLARQLRECTGTCVDATGHRRTWSKLDHVLGATQCPSCAKPARRPYRRFALIAGRRGGKTQIGGLSAIDEATVPGSVGWACAPSFPELEDYVMPAFFSQLPATFFDDPRTEWSEDRKSLILPNRAQVHFRSLDDPSRGAGPALDWAWIDEGRKIQELAWQILKPALVDKKGIAWVTTSPDWGEDWVYRNFWLPAQEGRPGYWATKYRTVDNPSIDPEEVEAARHSMPPALFRREFEASIEFPAGTIYGEILDKVEATDDQVREWIPEWPRVDPSRPRICGLDPGTDHPFAAADVVVTPYGLVQVGEYLAREKTFLTHAAGIRLMLQGGTPRFGIDRSAAQAAIELAQHGIFAQTVSNAVEAGLQRVYAWMATGQMRIAVSRCPQTVKQLRGYRYADLDETKKGLPRDGAVFKKDDDLPDALRYAVMLWPELPAKVVSGLAPGQRNLALLTSTQQRELERNREPDDLEEGLIRVTDNFSPVYDDGRPLRDSSLADFYR